MRVEVLFRRIQNIPAVAVLLKANALTGVVEVML